jgi:DNA/RNA endonuclease YhcR with UshA esterase domain
MRTKIAVILACSGLCLAATVPVVAHHAFGAEFDPNLPLILTGPVTKVEWVNPHTWIHLEVTNEDGTKTSWMVEGGTPNTLLRRGVTKNSLLPGTVIVVDGYQSKDRSNRANGRDITFPDGRKLFMGSSGTGAPRDGSDQTEPPTSN